MIELQGRLWPRWVCFAAVLALCRCGGGAPAVAPVAQSTPSRGFAAGTVVAVRPVSGETAGMDAVLAALQAPAPQAGGLAARQEVVIRRADDTAVSLVTEQPGVAVGDQVVVTTGADGAVLRRN